METTLMGASVWHQIRRSYQIGMMHGREELADELRERIIDEWRDCG